MKLTKSDLKVIVKECLLEMLQEPAVAAKLMESLNRPAQPMQLGSGMGRPQGQASIMSAILEDTANTTMRQQMSHDPEQLYNEQYAPQFATPQQVYAPQQQMPMQQYTQPMQQQPQFAAPPQQRYMAPQQQQRQPQQQQGPGAFSSNWARLAFNQPIKLGGADHEGGGGGMLGGDPNFLPGRTIGQF